MACFIVPMTTGIFTTLFRKKIPEALHIGWLNIMLWGGVLMLAVEHIAHQEVVLYPPFLTAMKNPADIPVMLHEMATIGVAMTVVIFAAWIILVLIAKYKEEPKTQTTD
jgi:hypothetical protein